SARRIASRPDLAPPCTPVPATLPFCRWAAAGAFPWRCTPHRSAASASGCPSLLSFSSLPQHSHAANDVSVPHGAQEFAGMFEQVHDAKECRAPGILQHPAAMAEHLALDGLLRLAEPAAYFGVGLAGEPHVTCDLQLFLRPPRLDLNDLLPPNLGFQLFFSPAQHRGNLCQGVADPPHQGHRLDLPFLPRRPKWFDRSATFATKPVLVLPNVLAARIDRHDGRPHVGVAGQALDICMWGSGY